MIVGAAIRGAIGGVEDRPHRHQRVGAARQVDLSRSGTDGYRRLPKKELTLTIHNDIQTRITAFAAELETLVRAAAIDAVRSALGQPAEARPRVPATPVVSRADAPSASTSPTRTGSRRKGGKRDPKELDALTERLASYIKANEGKRVEEIGKALSTPTKELALPIIRLLGNRTIRKTGQKRATQYFTR